MDFQEIASGIGSSDALKDAAQKVGFSPDQAQAALQGVLEHVSAGGPAEGMIESVAGKFGLPADQVQQFLPMVMGLVQNHADTAGEAAPAGLMGMLGSLQSSPLAGLLGGAAQNEGGAGGLVGGLLGGLFGGKKA